MKIRRQNFRNRVQSSIRKFSKLEKTRRDMVAEVVEGIGLRSIMAVGCWVARAESI